MYLSVVFLFLFRALYTSQYKCRLKSRVWEKNCHRWHEKSQENFKLNMKVMKVAKLWTVLNHLWYFRRFRRFLNFFVKTIDNINWNSNSKRRRKPMFVVYWATKLQKLLCSTNKAFIKISTEKFVRTWCHNRKKESFIGKFNRTYLFALKILQQKKRTNQKTIL